MSLEFDTSGSNTYTVDEDNQLLQVCLRAVGDITQEFSVTITTIPSSATGNYITCIVL